MILGHLLSLSSVCKNLQLMVYFVWASYDSSVLCVFLLSVRFYYLRAVVSYVASVFTAYVVYDSIWPLGRIQRSNIEGKKKKSREFSGSGYHNSIWALCDYKTGLVLIKGLEIITSFFNTAGSAKLHGRIQSHPACTRLLALIMLDVAGYHQSLHAWISFLWKSGEPRR